MKRRRHADPVDDLLGDPDALARAADVVDAETLEHARQSVARVQGAAAGSARAGRRDPGRGGGEPADIQVASLARELGLNVSRVRAVLLTPV